MYWVVSIIPSEALDRLTEKFSQVGVVRFTVAEVEMVNPQSVVSAGNQALRVEVALNEEFLPPALKVLEQLRSAGFDVTTHVGQLSDAMRTRTGEMGPEAI
ncbi:MAG: hypothetical protein OSB09_07195 [Planctomycetota bacterium]|nr:hypothetical protein [Planctomycetota bacterium]